MSDFFLLMKQELAITVIIFFLLFVKITGKRANAGLLPWIQLFQLRPH